MQEPEKVLVPAMVGLTLADATRLAATAGVTLEQVTGTVTQEAVVDAQQPQAGLQVEPGSTVQVTVDDTGNGGGSALDPPPPVLDGPGEATPVLDGPGEATPVA